MGKMLGVMLDCSRNAVMRPEKVKEFADIIRKMGYNTLMLYTEDTYEIESQPCFGHLRGRYTKAELKDMDSYCQSIGIELIPCIQTLAHLKQIFLWKTKYREINDCDDILLVGEEKTYELIDDMLSTLSECFSTRKIHIGMDEAYNVGNGVYMEKHGIRDRFDIINEHLHKVCEIADKYSLEPMIWSDMFVKLAAGMSGKSDQYGEMDTSKILERAALPENVSLVYWDYYKNDYELYDKQIKRNKLFNRPLYFAGGAWTWGGFAPFNKLSIDRTDKALSACMDNGVDGIFFTVWGDDTSECSRFTILPTLMFAAEKLRGNNDMEKIKEKFLEITGIPFDSFVMLDELDSPGGNHSDNNTAAKYLLYNDVFMGLRDYLCNGEENLYYEKLADKIKNAEKGKYSVIFESYENLARVLSIKADLGIKTRKAYLDNNKEELKKLIKEYDKALDLLNEFFYAYQAMWYDENKTFGFDVQDIRLGGLIRRITSCKERLEQFVNGEITEIPELKETVIAEDSGNYCWRQIVSPNLISFPN